MCPVLPLDMAEIDELQKCFVDERGGLKGVAGPLSLHVISRDAGQLRVDQRNQPCERSSISSSPCPEEVSHLSG